MDIKELIYKFALMNAVKFDGKANQGAIIGMLLSEDSGLKKKMKDISKQINETIKKVNAMKLEDQTEELNKIDPQALVKKKKEKVKELPELPGAVDGKVITRIPPEPSKYNHLGHALSFLINYMYAKKYHGKCILRFEDTNPEKAAQEYVDAMKKDVLEYLDIKPDKIVFVSDDMEKFYKLALELIKKQKAYVCFCEREKMQDLRHKGKECECRNNKIKENQKEWETMLKGGYEGGKAVLRLKIDMSLDNQVMRDPVIFRIIKHPHYRQKNKYVVWPLYDFENAIEEHLCGITHVLRSNEFGKMRTELQDYIKKILGFEKQVVMEYGRFNIKGSITQGREIRALIERKEVSGWDDPRLITLKALKRRGILKETFYELVYEVGITPTQTNLDFGVLAAINRKLLDAKSHRYFFIQEPVEISVQGAPEQVLELDLHPDNIAGGRKFKTKDKFYIQKKDLDSIKDGELVRLMDCLNFTKQGNSFKFVSTKYEEFKEKGKKIIHWLPIDKSQVIKAKLLMPDNTTVEGYIEYNASSLNVNDICQLERNCFCRLDNKTDSVLEFWFAHR